MVTVEHDTAGHRFLLKGADGSGELAYRPRGSDTLEFQHTFVDDSLRGSGAADTLVRAGFDYAREGGFRVIATCPYVRAWLRRHPNELAVK